jgi:hypothetical protein
MNEKYKIEINTINLATTTCRLELIKDFAFGEKTCFSLLA